MHGFRRTRLCHLGASDHEPRSNHRNELFGGDDDDVGVNWNDHQFALKCDVVGVVVASRI